jgi:hypothetical protein
MTQLLTWLERLLSGPSLGHDLESFIISKYPKTHADVEYWSKYWEFRGL